MLVSQTGIFIQQKLLVGSRAFQRQIDDLHARNAALEDLALIDPRQSRLVELRFFGGLTVNETAVVLGVAPITVKRDWALARAWLFRALRAKTS